MAQKQVVFHELFKTSLILFNINKLISFFKILHLILLYERFNNFQKLKR